MTSSPASPPDSPSPSVGELSESTQNYLKTIWGMTEWSREPVTATALAGAMGLRKSTVSDAIRRLGAAGYVEHAPYGSIALTPAGREHAVAMVRRHRLLETFLVEVLGYTWDQVHDEAEVLEHSVSEFMVERIDARLGHPERDPHGDPIPRPDGTVHAPRATTLAELPVGQDGVVQRISDADPDLLRFFAEAGVGVETRVRRLGERGFDGGTAVAVTGRSRPLPLGEQALAALFVSPA